MKQVVAEPVEGVQAFQSSADVSHVRFEFGELVVTLISGGDRKLAMVRFTDSAGFRLLDEGDLLEFWPACAGSNGWLFRIQRHGWLEQESSRPGFLRTDVPGLQEYFISSENSCVSVLASEVPSVEILGL